MSRETSALAGVNMYFVTGSLYALFLHFGVAVLLHVLLSM